MAVHHDKAVYGKLSRLQTELSDDEIDNAVAAINALSVEDHAVKDNIQALKDKNFSDKKSNRKSNRKSNNRGEPKEKKKTD